MLTGPGGGSVPVDLLVGVSLHGHRGAPRLPAQPASDLRCTPGPGLSANYPILTAWKRDAGLRGSHSGMRRDMNATPPMLLEARWGERERLD